MKKFTAAVAFLGVILSVTPAFAQSRSTTPKKIKEEAKTTFYQARAYNAGKSTWISWDIDILSNSIAYDVYRLSAKGFERISESPIPNARLALGFLDRQGTLGDTYRIDAISPNGSRTSSSPISTEYISSLSAVSERSEEELSAVTLNSSSDIYQSSLILPQELRNETIKTAPPADLVAQRMVAVQNGVKIGIRKTGVYRVTRAELQAAGFDVATDPTRWQLFSNGNEQAIVVEPSGNFIDFYAKAIDTIESDIAMLYLVNGATSGKRMKTRVARPNITPVQTTNYNENLTIARKVNYVYDILNGDAENYWGDIFWTNAANIPLTVTGIDYSQSSVDVGVTFQGFSTGQHVVNVLLNGQAIGVANSNGQLSFSASFAVPTSRLNEGTNTLTLTTTTGGDFVLFDNIKIRYARKYQADQNRVAFYINNNRRTTVTGFSSTNVDVYDTTNSSEPMKVTNLNAVQNGTTFDLSIPAYRSRVYYAVESSGLLQAFSVKPNFASSLATPNHNGRLVIVSHPDLIGEAENWAIYRRNQGISVEVVDVEDIYDEFSYGVSNAQAVSDFLLYAKNNWQTPPQYALLLGDASFDPRNYGNQGYQNMVPSKMVTTVYLETGSDEALADFNQDGLAEIAIGRIPAKTPQVVANALAKTIAFEMPALQNLNRGAVFAYDEPNGFDFAAMSHIMGNELPTTMPIVYVDRLAANSQQTLITQMNLGRYVANYSGHGTTGNWYGSAFFGINNLNPTSGMPLLNNGTNYSLFTMLTCLNGYFINPYTDSLSERLGRYDNGGSAANWASTGKTTPDVQLVMGQRFFNRLGAGTIPRLGDLINDAKSVVSGGTDVRLSWALFGDPMLKVR